MKKLTKKELEAIENERKEMRHKRLEMIRSLESFWKDVDATIRVAKLNDNKEMLSYSDRLVKSEEEKLWNNYENLKGLTEIQTQALRILVWNKNERDQFFKDKYCIMKEQLPEDAVWIRDIIWKEEDLIEMVNFYKSLGITKMYYTDKSTAALHVIVWLTRLGCKIADTTKISEFNEGLIIEL